MKDYVRDIINKMKTKIKYNRNNKLFYKKFIKDKMKLMKIKHLMILYKKCLSFFPSKLIYAGTHLKVNINNCNGMWLGDNVGKIAVHNWVRRRKPETKLCEFCRLKPPYELANLTGYYLRDLNDYRWLCRSCHTKFDGKGIHLKRYQTQLIRDKKGRYMKPLK